jgi:hypothetical protein
VLCEKREQFKERAGLSKKRNSLTTLCTSTIAHGALLRVSFMIFESVVSARERQFMHATPRIVKNDAIKREVGRKR